MANLEKYNKAFLDSFEIDEKQHNDDLVYQSLASCDSVRYKQLTVVIDVMFKISDIINFASYNTGENLLLKYGVPQLC